MKHGFRFRVSSLQGKVSETHIYLFEDLTFDKLDDVEYDMARKALDSEYTIGIEHLSEIMLEIDMIRRSIDEET